MNPDLHTIATAAKIVATVLFVLAAGVLSAAYAMLQELRIITKMAKAVFTRLDWGSAGEVEH